MGMIVALIWSYTMYMYYHIALYPVNIYNYMPNFVIKILDLFMLD